MWGVGAFGVDLEGLVLVVSRCGAANLILFFQIKDTCSLVVNFWLVIGDTERRKENQS